MEEETTLIGNYRLIEEIGAGSIGTVYQARHILTDHIVALKVLHVHLPAPEQERFMQETQFLANIRHHHILSVLEIGLDNDRPYIVSEYAPSGSLREVLNEMSVLSHEHALAILTQIGKALSYTHRRKIVHGDLKPENILFNAQGEAVLADFSIATVLSKMGIKQFADPEGDASYLAPEHSRGQVTWETDQYVLGYMAYEMVTGQRPIFSSSTSGSQRKKWGFIRPHEINAQVPAHMEEAILMALGEKKGHRHQSMAAFLKALQDFQNRDAVEAAWIWRAWSLMSDGKYEEALAAYEQASYINPNDAHAYTAKGDALYKLKRYEEALPAYEQALRIKPNDVQASHAKRQVLSILSGNEDIDEVYDPAEYSYTDLAFVMGLVKREK